MKIARVLISVSNKKGILDFAKKLHELEIELISTGGTARLLKDEGLPVTLISEFTGFPEILSGRVKTLHPKVHGGLLALRDNKEHQREMMENGIRSIDMVVVNLYPFEETIAREEVSLEEAIENIDIGGPSMLRSAAKNYKYVTVIVNPNKYDLVVDELKSNNGALSEEFRLRLAREAFALTSQYDAAIYSYLTNLIKPEGIMLPGELHLSFKKVEDLRYGENPHQRAAFYKDRDIDEPCIANSKQIQGKSLSFNNILDLNAAIEICKEFEEPAAAIIKHTNPCGVAMDPDLFTALQKAWETDPDSSFGSIIGFNRPITAHVAKEIIKNFIECIVCPKVTDEAKEILATKANMRVIVVEGLGTWKSISQERLQYDLKKVGGGLLLQEKDNHSVKKDDLKIITERAPKEEELKSLLFAWKVVKHVKSNAIVYVKGCETVGIGAGQMSRVDASRLAVQKAKKDLKGTVVASDAFFPFRDGVDVAFQAGATAVIQPGGSIRDEEVIQAANQHGMAMVFTGVRHFKH